jgi:hypothetical protein
MAVVSGRSPMQEAARLLAPDVVSHMDGYTVRGRAPWAAWVEFIRSRGVEGLEAEVVRFERGPDGTLTAVGRLRGTRRGRAVSAPGRARYRVERGRVVEIWTTRQNYEVVFGAWARHPLSWLAVLAYMSVWSRTPGRRRSPTTLTEE